MTLILMAGQEHFLPIKISASYDLRAVTFSLNGEHLFSGGQDQNVEVWGVQDGQRVVTMEAKDVVCFAVAKNGKWIAGSTWRGEAFMWDAKTHERVWRDWKGCDDIVDFSPDSTKLVSGSLNCTATTWDVASGDKIWTLEHKQVMITAKFSSDGNRIATATYEGSVRVWDSSNGDLLVDIPVMVTSSYNNGLLWFNNHIFVVSGSKIKQLDASTGSTVSEWPVPNSDIYSCIAVPRHGKVISCSTSHSVSFWDASTCLQIGLVEHTEYIRSIALSPVNRSLAIGGCYGSIITEGLPQIIVSIASLDYEMSLMPCSSFPSLSAFHPPGIRSSD